MLDKNVFAKGPVYPVVPFYDNNEMYAREKTIAYVEHLERNKAKILTTTAGTSQYNLMTTGEICQMNMDISSYFGGAVILGLPQLPLRTLRDQIWMMNEAIVNDQAAIMLLFPERYYSDKQVVDFFNAAAEDSDLPIFIHGLPMKSGKTGAPVEYSAALINKLAQNPKIIGMKEENKTLDNAYDFCYDVDNEFIKILAGKGSQKYLALLPIVDDRTSYLVGVGSIYPLIEEEFWKYCQRGEFVKAAKMVKMLETFAFSVMFRHGWHPSLRCAVGECGNRFPFPILSEKAQIEINSMKQRIKSMFENRELWLEND